MTPDHAKTKAKTLFFGEVSECELAVRMAEAALGIKRKPGWTTDKALAEMPADWGEAFQKAARAAMEYWRECIDHASQPS